MKNINRNLALLLILQLILVIIVWWPKQSATMAEPYIMAGAPWDAIQEVDLQGDGKTLVLRKDNGQWIVPEQYNFPADDKKIADFFAKLKGIKSGLSVGQTAQSFKKLEVSDDKYQRKVALKTADGKDDGFYLGSSPQFRRTHIRRLNYNDAFTTGDVALNDLSLKPQDWMKRILVKSVPGDLVQIDFKHGKEELLFKKDAQSIWMLDGKPVNKAKFDPIVRNLAALNLNAVAGTDEKSEYGLDHAATVTLSLKEGDKTTEKTFFIGAKSEQDYFVKQADSPFVVKVGAYQLGGLMETNRKALLADTRPGR